MQLTDPIAEKESRNRKVRDERKEALRELILNQKDLEQVYLLSIEKRGLFICAFVVPDPNDDSYDRCLIPGIDCEPLFAAEVQCSDSGPMSRDAAIPYVAYHDNNRIECIVIEPRTSEEIELFASGYDTVREQRSSVLLAPYMRTNSEVRD